MGGAIASSCGAHTEQLAIGDCRRLDERVNECFIVLDLVTQYLGTRPSVDVFGSACPRGVPERWQNCSLAGLWLESKGPFILETVLGALDQGVDVRNFNIELLFRALGSEAHRYVILIGPLADAVTNLESDQATCGDVIPTIVDAIDDMRTNAVELADVAGLHQAEMAES
jgi:hypothetical protein